MIMLCGIALKSELSNYFFQLFFILFVVFVARWSEFRAQTSKTKAAKLQCIHVYGNGYHELFFGPTEIGNN